MGSSSTASAELTSLLQAAADGDAGAFETLFEKFRPYLKQFVELRLDNRVRARVDASDIMQDTQIEIHERLQEFLDRRPMPFKLWLRQTALKQLLRAHSTHVKADRRTVTRESFQHQSSSIFFAKWIADDNDSPSNELMKLERSQRLNNALESLSDADREILMMRNIEELCFDEIAANFEITPEAARKRFGRALIRLHSHLR